MKHKLIICLSLEKYFLWLYLILISSQFGCSELQELWQTELAVNPSSVKRRFQDTTVDLYLQTCAESPKEMWENYSNAFSPMILLPASSSACENGQSAEYSCSKTVNKTDEKLKIFHKMYLYLLIEK